MSNNNNDLTTAPVPKLIKQIAIPASVGFFFNTMFNVTDTFYGGLISTEAVAALSLSFPVFFIILAMGSGISTGATALIANALGKGDAKKAHIYGVQAISFGIIASLLLTIFGLGAAPFFARLLGAEGTYLQITLDYINIIFYGTVFFLLTFIMNSMLNARGDTKTFRNLLIVGYLLNLLLDPWFIYGWLGFPALGLKGVAWSTILIQAAGAGFLTYKLKRDGMLTCQKGGCLIPQPKIFAEIAKQGIPASLNMMTVALGIFVITYFISMFGKEAVAAYGIATRIEQMALIPNIGLNIATLTLVGQAFGAGRIDRIKEIYKTALKYGIVLVTVGMVIIGVLMRQMFELFTDNQNVIAIGLSYVRIALFIYWAYIILYVTVSALQGLKRPNFAMVVGLARQVLGPVVIFYVIVKVFGIGLTGVWWGIFGVTWLAALVSLWYTWRVFRAVEIVTDTNKRGSE